MTGSLDLAGFPQALANAFGTTLLGGQLIASAILLLIGLLPTLVLTKNIFAHTMVGVVLLALSVALGWLPAWIFIILMLLIAALVASMFRSWLSGSGDNT